MNADEVTERLIKLVSEAFEDKTTTYGDVIQPIICTATKLIAVSLVEDNADEAEIEHRCQGTIRLMRSLLELDLIRARLCLKEHNDALR